MASSILASLEIEIPSKIGKSSDTEVLPNPLLGLQAEFSMDSSTQKQNTIQRLQAKNVENRGNSKYSITTLPKSDANVEPIDTQENNTTTEQEIPSLCSR